MHLKCQTHFYNIISTRDYIILLNNIVPDFPSPKGTELAVTEIQ